MVKIQWVAADVVHPKSSSGAWEYDEKEAKFSVWASLADRPEWIRKNHTDLCVMASNLTEGRAHFLISRMYEVYGDRYRLGIATEY